MEFRRVLFRSAQVIRHRRAREARGELADAGGPARGPRLLRRIAARTESGGARSLARGWRLARPRARRAHHGDADEPASRRLCEARAPAPREVAARGARRRGHGPRPVGAGAGRLARCLARRRPDRGASTRSSASLIRTVLVANRPRHVEIQVFGDGAGTVVHVHERDCSIQRRHQKLVEESPAPNLAPTIKDGLARAAVAGARAIDYVNAGTMEVRVDTAGRLLLPDMTTPVQIEQPAQRQAHALEHGPDPG